MLRCGFFQRGIEVLGRRFAAEAARDRSNGCTNGGANRSGGDRADRSTGSNSACDTACRRSKADSNRVRSRGASNRVWIRSSLFCVVIVHSVLRCRYTLHRLALAAWRT
jgi:hypothetical protein